VEIKALKPLLVIFVLAFSGYAAESVESLMASGQSLLERGAYSQAVTAFRQVVSRESDNFEAQFNLAFAYLQWGRSNNAVEEFKKALVWQPKNSQVWANLAIAYGNLNKKEEALYSLNQAVTFDSQNITARMNLASMYANADRMPQALEQYKKVLEIDPTHEEALVNMSKCLIGEKQFDEAIKYLKQLVVAYPNNGEVHYELANIYWKIQKNIGSALSEYKLAVTLTPENISFYDNYSAALIEKGEKVDAIEVLKKSLLYTDDPLKKDKIQNQINRLETGDRPAEKNPENTSAKMESKEGINDLKKELRKDNSSETKRIETKPVNIMGDLESVSSDTTKTLDLRGEAKKRAAVK
jgi:tetratricopeptide (TPR) repeat protein